MKNWRFVTVSLVVVLLIATALISACTTEEAAEPETVVQKETVVVEKEVEVAVQYDAAWAKTPMEETTTVVLSVESGAQETTLGSFHDEILAALNIDLQVVAHPFSEQYEIQLLDLSSGAGQYDILSYWPMYTADFYKFLSPFADVVPGGEDWVSQDLDYEDVMDGYRWCYIYKDKFYSAQYDGDVKLLHYRYDIATDPEVHAAFVEEYGYDFDVQNLTWDQLLDVATFVQEPDSDFYGMSEIAGFLAGFTLKDHLWGYGGHLFDYDTMDALGGTGATGESNYDICVAAVQNGQDLFNTAAPPEAHSFEFEDARNQIIVHDRVMFHTMWPDGWKWANDPNLGSETAVCNVGVAEMPGFERSGKLFHRPNENGGRVLAINGASKVKEAAYKVIVFFQDPERTTELVYNNDTWLDPWRKSHVEPAAAAHLCQGCEWNCQLYMDIIRQSTVDGYPALQIPGAGRYHEVLERWAKKAFANQVTAEETCTGIRDEFDQITDEIGRDAQILEYQAYVDGVLKVKGLWP